MANNPKKTQDPTEAALSAIQEALHVRDEALPATGTRPATPRTAKPVTPPAEDDDLFAPETRKPRNGDQATARRAANDDRETIGQILQAVQRRPSHMSYSVATIFAAGWIIACAALGWVYMADLEALWDQGPGAMPVLVGLGALVVVPIMLSYFLAHMVWRSQELRLVAQSMAEVALRLAEPENVARESMVSVGQAIRREVAAMGDGVERALARAAELEALVHNEVSALERAYNDNEVRIRGLLHDLASQRDTLVEQAEQVRSAISSVHLDLSQDISQVSDLVAQKVNEAAHRITQTLAERGQHITVALGHAGDSMIAALSTRGGDLIERLENTSDNATRAISDASERLASSLDFKTDNIHQEFAGLATGLTQMVSSQLSGVARDFEQQSAGIVELMSGRAQQLTNSITDCGAVVVETLAGRVDEVNNTLRTTGDSLVLDLSLRGDDVVANLEQTGTRITEAIISRSETVTNTFRDSAENLVHVVDAKGDAIKTMLAARLLAFEEMFTHDGAELGEKITRESSTLGNLITRHLSEFDRTVKTYGGEIVERLGERTTEVSESLRKYVDGFDDRLKAKVDEMSGSLDQRLLRFQDAMDGRTQSLNETLNTRVAEIAATLTTGGKDVIASLDKRINEISDTINSRGAKLADSIAAKIADIDKALGTSVLDVTNNLDTRIGRIAELNNSIKTNAGDAERALTKLSSNVSTTLKENATDVERTLLGVSAEVARSFVGKADEITTAINQKAADLGRLLEQNSGGLLTALTEKRDEFAGHLNRATAQAIKEIEAKGFTFTEAMITNTTDIAQKINEASEAAATAVNRTMKDLHTATQSAIEQSKTTATATVSEMLETHSMLRNDTTALFERLREANILLQEVLSGAHENMSSLENTMTNRVSEFVSAMNLLSESSGAVSAKVEEQAGKFHNVTSRVLTNLSDLSGQFQAHAQDLASAVELVERSNQRTEETLGERRVALDSLVSTLDIRTEDLEQRLKRFTGLLDESLDAASGRAREIARLVSDASLGGAQAITEQFEQVRVTSEEERKRTVEAMARIYEDAQTDTNSIFRQATERFTEVVQSMKVMAAEMQRELETTRGELRRGILELPQETAESAAQMRRVIVDQIEALAELNRIVARHGRSMDAVEPARRGPRESAMAMAGPPETMRSPARPAAPAAPTRRADAPSLSPAANNGRGGWLTDLLQRASREDGEGAAEIPRETLRGAAGPNGERPPRHSIESLDSLSVDIARMIDHDAAAELWDKYKRGERNVFTRRLYTLQGQKAFDEIRKKYRLDREFKQTVDRYIGEFERLLDEVSKDDRGQVVARTYLTSETGKVYTMLAHAAGRFE